jgi:hypothetical protein
MLTMSIVQDSNETGRLYLNASALRATGRIGASVIDISPYFSPERARVEEFIRQVYANTYHADIAVHYPTLMSVRTASGNILSAIGFRYAAEEPLFLEQYTGQPIELCLSECYNKPVMRREIAEIGNLASLGSGASMYLFAALSSYLHARKIRYATITGTGALRERLRKLGLEPYALCQADPAKLSDEERLRWGSYYDQNPQVLCGSVEEGVHHLQHALGMMYEEQVNDPLFSRVHFKDVL